MSVVYAYTAACINRLIPFLSFVVFGIWFPSALRLGIRVSGLLGLGLTRELNFSKRKRCSNLDCDSFVRRYIYLENVWRSYQSACLAAWIRSLKQGNELLSCTAIYSGGSI